MHIDLNLGNPATDPNAVVNNEDGNAVVNNEDENAAVVNDKTDEKAEVVNDENVAVVNDKTDENVAGVNDEADKTAKTKLFSGRSIAKLRTNYTFVFSIAQLILVCIRPFCLFIINILHFYIFFFFNKQLTILQFITVNFICRLFLLRKINFSLHSIILVCIRHISVTLFFFFFFF